MIATTSSVIPRPTLPRLGEPAIKCGAARPHATPEALLLQGQAPVNTRVAVATTDVSHPLARTAAQDQIQNLADDEQQHQERGCLVRGPDAHAHKHLCRY